MNSRCLEFLREMHHPLFSSQALRQNLRISFGVKYGDYPDALGGHGEINAITPEFLKSGHSDSRGHFPKPLRTLLDLLEERVDLGIKLGSSARLFSLVPSSCIVKF